LHNFFHVVKLNGTKGDCEVVDPIGASPQISNPLLQFRLDPGEAGVLRSARATDATAQVTAQEQRNASGLVADATRSGQVVTRREINYTTRRVGDVTTVTDGQTTVATRPDNTPGIVPSPELPVVDPRAESVSVEVNSTPAVHEDSLELFLLSALSGTAVFNNTDTGSNLLIPKPSSLLAQMQEALNLRDFRQYFPQPGTNVSVFNVEGEEQVEGAPAVEESGPAIETFV